jgi:hypothetical protein
VGLALSGTDLANFITNSAKAKGILQQIDQQAAIAGVDLKNYQDSQAEKLYMQKMQDQLDLQFQLRKSIQDAEVSKNVSYITAGAGAFFVACLGIGFIVLTTRFKRNAVVVQTSQVKYADLWSNPAWRATQLRIARYNEKTSRANSLRTNYVPASVSPFIIDTPIEWEDLVKGSRK